MYHWPNSKLAPEMPGVCCVWRVCGVII